MKGCKGGGGQTSATAPLTAATFALALASTSLGSVGCADITGLSGFGVDAGVGGSASATGPGGSSGSLGGDEPSGGDSSTAAGGNASSVLDDGDLVVRYYFDEADEGLVATAFDASPLQAHLTLYDDLSGMSYTEDAAGNRGIRWLAVEGGGRAQLDDTAALVDALNATTGITVEVVVQAEQASSGCPRFFHYGDAGGDGSLAACMDTDPLEQVELRLHGADVAVTDAGGLAALLAGGRQVLHFVLDHAAANAQDRARYYVDGGLVVNGANGVSAVPQQPFALPSNRSLVIGNRPSQDRSPRGVIYYTAIYAAAFTGDRVANHAAILLANDDTP